MDRRTDGQKDGWAEGLMDRRTDGLNDKNLEYESVDDRVEDVWAGVQD